MKTLLYRGFCVDRCYDCGKMENVIFWPFWVPDMHSPAQFESAFEICKY